MSSLEKSSNAGETTRLDTARSSGSVTLTGQVDIASAEAKFNELAREFSRHSELEKPDADVEKGDVAENEGAFDLREYLTSSNDANDAAGIKHKHVGVTWENLQVDVMGGSDSKIYIGTFGKSLRDFVLTPIFFIYSLILRFLPSKPISTRTILHPSSGVLKPGEMCLVLGCPGSGCTTFLKAIANRREGYAAVRGDVKYAGMNAEEMAKYYKGEVVFNQENDIHFATLTVAQTLSFALSTKTPGSRGRLPGITRSEFNSTVLKTLLRMLNITHTSSTLVGDEFVPGISGGERKRVSIAEMMTTRARVQCWDNSTRGLDASTALDFVKCLRIMTDVLRQTTFVSLYQAGESIYELFDKVIVLDEGRQVYFGPPAEARLYFESIGYNHLPRESTADYLTGCTDPNERQFSTSVSPVSVPSTPPELERTFVKSHLAETMRVELEAYKTLMETDKADQEAFRAAVAADKKKGVSRKSPYTLGFWGQVKALTVRQFRLRLQDRFQLCTSFGLALLLAPIIGGAFFDLPTTSAGAFTRASVIFIAMLTICFDAFGEIVLQMLGRPILRKQTAYGLYRPAAIPFANTLADLPFSSVRILLFNIIVYFMTHLARSGGAFWTFHLLNYLSFLTMQGFFRTLGLLCGNFHAAFRWAIIFIPNMIQYTGYLIPVSAMKRWLFWIYYVNPMAFTLAAITENEFMRISLTCDGDSVVPRNGPGVSKYPDVLGPNQACTLFGASPGSNVISGSSYIDVGYGLQVNELWTKNFVVLAVMFILFQLAQVFAIEYLPYHTIELSINIFAKSAADRNEKQVADEQTQTQKKDKEKPSSILSAHRKAFTWEKVSYDVPVPGGTRRLLHDVFGYVKPGTLTALMGASGAGKTTCLDVLALRKSLGVVSGNILVDGRPPDPSFVRSTAYAEQMDVHEGTATVREAMRFSAYLRQPYHVSEAEKDCYVEEMIELLELQNLADALVLSLSPEARKRLTIGVELASKPELLLFLDEPTSGLDAQGAWNLVRFLRKLADQGQAILCTIHQPSSLLFESFDRLLLLETGGETVYFGDIGRDSVHVRNYFARYGARCPPNANPAEYMLEAIGAGVTPRIGKRDWKDIWLESPELQQALNEIAEIKKSALALPAPPNERPQTYATPFLYQLKTVVQRNNVALWRSADYLFNRFFFHVVISLCVSLAYFQVGNSVRELQYRVFSIFWVTVLPTLLVFQVQAMFIFNRNVFVRESSSRIYSSPVFVLGQLLGEIPYSVVCAILYWVIMVYTIGYGQGAAGLRGTGFQLIIVIFMELFGVSLGHLIGAISPSVQVAVVFNPFFVITLTIFCGMIIPYPALHKFWRWLYELDPYSRTLSAMTSTELHGLAIRCQSDEFATFDPPLGQTCLNWAGDFVKAFGGYLDNPSDAQACRYCQYSVGDEFFVPLNIRYENRWRDAWILFAFFIFNIIVTLLASRYLRHNKR